MRDSLGNLLFQSATTVALDNYEVTPPCRAVVAGAGGGFVAIVDSFSSGDQSDTVLFTRPLIGNGIMREGQILPQVLLSCPIHRLFFRMQPLPPHRQRTASGSLSDRAGWVHGGRRTCACTPPTARFSSTRRPTAT